MVLKLDCASDMLAVLGHPGRLSVLRLLARRAPNEVRAGELADILDIPANTLSAYASALERAGFVVSERKGRSVRYSLVPSRMNELTEYLTQDCLCGRSVCHEPKNQWDVWPPVANVLFLCRQNDSRSIFAETLLNAKGGGGFRAYSAGATTSQSVPSCALRTLCEKGYDTSEITSKNEAQLRSLEAIKMDLVITLCDEKANEDEPGWPGTPLRAHWSTADPASQENRKAADPMSAFRDVFALMAERIHAFTQLPFQRLDRVALQGRIDALAHLSVPSDRDWRNDVMCMSQNTARGAAITDCDSRNTRRT